MGFNLESELRRAHGLEDPANGVSSRTNLYNRSIPTRSAWGNVIRDENKSLEGIRAQIKEETQRKNGS